MTVFDARGKVVWRSWLWRHSSPWVSACTEALFRAHAHGAAFRSNLTVLTRGTANERAASRLAAKLATSHALANALADRDPSSHVHERTSSNNASSALRPQLMGLPSLEMMVTFPIIVPRAVLPEVRRLTRRAGYTGPWTRAPENRLFAVQRIGPHETVCVCLCAWTCVRVRGNRCAASRCWQ